VLEVENCALVKITHPFNFLIPGQQCKLKSEISAVRDVMFRQCVLCRTKIRVHIPAAATVARRIFVRDVMNVKRVVVRNGQELAENAVAKVPLCFWKSMKVSSGGNDFACYLLLATAFCDSFR
jgi:hypothetical protein